MASYIGGNVNQNGGTLNGAGFTSERLSKGSYQITFSSSFDSIPAVNASIVAAGNDGNKTIHLYNHSKDGFNVAINSGSGDHKDSDFSFICMEPSS